MNEVTLQEVRIDRGRSVIHRTVPIHEVRVLRAVHGLEAVQVVDANAGTATFDTNSDIEIARLQRAYQRLNAPDPVLIAFPTGAQGLVEFGFSPSTNSPLAPEANTGLRTHKPAAPKAKKAA